jgi:hypothetical protein
VVEAMLSPPQPAALADLFRFRSRYRITRPASFGESRVFVLRPEGPANRIGVIPNRPIAFRTHARQ